MKIIQKLARIEAQGSLVFDWNAPSGKRGAPVIGIAVDAHAGSLAEVSDGLKLLAQQGIKCRIVITPIEETDVPK